MILDTVKIKNFKAIRNSGIVKLGSLTALVGNNGSGKSSLIEALETYQSIVHDGLDTAMQRFMGIEHVQNKCAKPDAPICFDFGLRGPFGKARIAMSVASDKTRAAYAITDELVKCKKNHAILEGVLGHERDHFGQYWKLGLSMLGSSMYREYANLVESWQFLTLNPDRMGYPFPQKRTGGHVRLTRDGSNIAEFLLELRRLDASALEGIIQTMAFVLPYARDLQPAITSELERKTWLQLSEGEFKVPGWMLSTGTLRVLALLALLRHPNPPPLLFIEEIENGLDPRSIHLLVEEIRNAVLSRRIQVILTTHSPYLLDLLKLEQVILVTRDEEGVPCFFRPANHKGLQEWSKEFSPGRLYTMGSLHEAVQ